MSEHLFSDEMAKNLGLIAEATPAPPPKAPNPVDGGERPVSPSHRGWGAGWLVLLLVVAVSATGAAGWLWLRLKETEARAERATDLALGGPAGGAPVDKARLEKDVKHHVPETTQLTEAKTRVSTAENQPTARDKQITELERQQKTIEEAGEWKITYTHGVVREYRIDKDGKVRFEEENLEGQIKRKGLALLLEFEGDNRLERLTLSTDGRLFVEHYDPKDDFSGGKAKVIGVGVRRK